jgi:hypothetical protein
MQQHDAAAEWWRLVAAVLPDIEFERQRIVESVPMLLDVGRYVEPCGWRVPIREAKPAGGREIVRGVAGVRGNPVPEGGFRTMMSGSFDVLGGDPGAAIEAETRCQQYPSPSAHRLPLIATLPLAP